MQCVQYTREFERIRLLPRRDWEARAGGLVEPLTRLLRTQGGTMTLRPEQAIVLAELYEQGGVFFQGRVSIGKTLISLLAPVILGHTGVPAKRPMLVIPANLRTKTLRDFQRLREHWQTQAIRIVSYHELGVVSGADTLTSYMPDLIVLDEAHRAKNLKDCSGARRLDRYFRGMRKAGQLVRCAAFSGTIAGRSIRDFAHILWWCLPHLYPLPVSEAQLQMWACASDEGRAAEAKRVEPGVLLSLADAPAGNDDVCAARNAIRSRVFSTPGAIAVRDAGMARCSLYVAGRVVEPPAVVEDAIRKLRSEFKTPDEWSFADRPTLWRHARELSCGFYYRWDPRPPKEWADARTAWHAEARDVLSRSRHLDTEKQLKDEVDAFVAKGKAHRSAELLAAWRAVHPSFRPNKKAVWLSDHMIEWARAWGEKEKGLIWTQHRAFGERLAHVTGWSFFVNDGLDSSGRYIEDAPAGPAIASVKANKEGRNLQHTWSKALIVSCDPTGGEVEQIIGRIHRDGQLADEVHIDVAFGCVEMHDGFLQARADQEYHRSVLGAEEKLLNCDWLMPDSLPATPAFIRT